MTKNLKTLLLVSAISLTVSACAHNQGKDSANGMPCKMTEHLKAASASTDKVVKELNDAATETTDAKRKKHLNKLIKEANVLSKDISKTKAMCDVKKDAEKAPVAKKTKKPAKVVVTPATPAAAPAATDKK